MRLHRRIANVRITATGRPDRGPADGLLEEVQDDILKRNPDLRRRLAHVEAQARRRRP